MPRSRKAAKAELSKVSAVPVAKEKPPIVGTFRIKTGGHYEWGNAYNAGDVFESTKDLAKFDPNKFERIDATTRPAVTPSKPGLEPSVGATEPTLEGEDGGTQDKRSEGSEHDRRGSVDTDDPVSDGGEQSD